MKIRKGKIRRYRRVHLRALDAVIAAAVRRAKKQRKKQKSRGASTRRPLGTPNY